MLPKRRRVGRERARQPDPNALPDDLYDYTHEPAQRRSSPPHAFDLATLPVIDDWPEMVPITEAEIQVFERWFGDVLDEMFGSVGQPKDLQILSRDDNEGQ